MTLSLSILTIAGTLYSLAFLFHLAAFLGGRDGISGWGLVLVRVGFLVHTFFFFSRTKSDVLLIPVSDFGHVMAFFSWALAFVYLVLLARVQSEPFGLILAPLLALLVGVGLLGFHRGQIAPPSPLNPYFLLHLGTAFFAYASFTLSSAAAILYLVQHRMLKRKRGGTFYHRLPSLEALEGLIYQPMAWGTFLLALAVGIGFLWSKSAFGTFWLWEPKTFLTLVTVFFYCVLIYFHYGKASRGKRLVVMNLVAFAFIFLNFFGANFLGTGLHQFLK